MPSVAGYCKRCDTIHSLPAGATEEEAHRLLDRLMQQGSLDIFSSLPTPNPSFALEPLFGEARGKMLGILEGLDKTGKRKFLYAFSGQYNGQWHIPGWVPPPLSPESFYALYNESVHRIQSISKDMAKTPRETSLWTTLHRKRRQISRNLNTELQKLYRLHNFCGENAGVHDIFGEQGVPTGTGECCTPKLLDYAAQNGFKPLGICEFFVGRTTRSGSCEHGHFYPPCTTRCQPLLGFMLCGIEQL